MRMTIVQRLRVLAKESLCKVLRLFEAAPGWGNREELARALESALAETELVHALLSEETGVEPKRHWLTPKERAGLLAVRCVTPLACDDDEVEAYVRAVALGECESWLADLVSHLGHPELVELFLEQSTPIGIAGVACELEVPTLRLGRVPVPLA